VLDNALRIQATNLVSTITVTVPLQHSEAGEFVVPLADFRSVLTKAGTAIVAGTVQDSKLTLITPDHSRFRLPLLSVDDFPKSDIPSEAECHTLPTKRFTEALTMARAAATGGGYTPGLRQIAIRPGVILSGDGISFRKVLFPENKYLSADIPVTELRALLGILPSIEASRVIVGGTGSRFSVEVAGVWLTMQGLADEFPDVTKVIESAKVESTDQLTVDRSALMTALSKLSSHDYENVKIRLHTIDKISVSAEDDSYQFETEIPALWEGAPMEVQVDRQRFRDLVSSSSDDTLAFRCSESGPLLLQDSAHVTLLNQVA